MKCANCGKKAEIFNKYLNKWVCKSCFSKMIENRIRKSIRDLIFPNDKVLLIISNNPTCQVFSYYFPTITEKIPNVSLFGLYVNTTGKKLVKNNFKFKIKTVNKKSKNCNECKDYRKEILKDVCKNYDKVISCLSADKLAIRLLYDILIKGKKPSFKIKQGKTIYPTVKITDDEAKIYCKIKNIRYEEDCYLNDTEKDIQEFLKDVENRRKGSIFGLINALLKQR